MSLSASPCVVIISPSLFYHIHSHSDQKAASTQSVWLKFREAAFLPFFGNNISPGDAGVHSLHCLR